MQFFFLFSFFFINFTYKEQDAIFTEQNRPHSYWGNGRRGGRYSQTEFDGPLELLLLQDSWHQFHLHDLDEIFHHIERKRECPTQSSERTRLVWRGGSSRFKELFDNLKMEIRNCKINEKKKMLHHNFSVLHFDF